MFQILEHLIEKEEKRTKIVQNKHVMDASDCAYEKRKKEEPEKEEKEKWLGALFAQSRIMALYTWGLIRFLLLKVNYTYVHILRYFGRVIN